MSESAGNLLHQFQFVRTVSVMTLIAFIGCTKPHQVHSPQPMPVTCVEVDPRNLPVVLEFVAVAESSHIIQLRARVEGYLQSINYKEGSLVKEGDLMFVIDQRPFIAALENAQGDLARYEAILWNTQQTKARMIPLYDANAVSEKDLDDALAEEMAAQANVDAALAQVYQAELNLEFASIKAPRTAMSGQAKYREGALISPGEQSLLTTLYVVDPIWINFSLSDRELLKIRDQLNKKLLIFPQDEQFYCEAILSDGTLVPSRGSIDFTAPAIQQDTGTLLIRTIFPNPQNDLFPGQFVKIKIRGAYRPNCIAIPQTAVVQSQAGPFVYVVNATNRLEKRAVELGDWLENDWVILSGLKKGDLVVTQGVNKLMPGMQVYVTQSMPSHPKDLSPKRSGGY
jgi:membrane fusion protein (multidrug efflux system)